MPASSRSCNSYYSMDVQSVFHVKEGLGEASYAQNSSIQKRGTDAMKHAIIDAAVGMCLSESPKCFSIADLGCASGSNALALISEIVDAIDEKFQEVSRLKPEIMVYLNDLPSNDFNPILMGFSDFISGRLRSGWERESSQSIYLAVVPGSFYGRLFQSHSLHFVHSAHSLHWLSQVPPGLFSEEGIPLNKGKIYISESSPPCVANAYLQQFQKDFNVFLHSRSKEIIPNGLMALLMCGRTSPEPHNMKTTLLWELLAESFSLMVSLGKIKENDADMYNAPFYAPSLKEIEDEVHKEGSFMVEYLEIFECKLSNGNPKQDGRNVAKAIQAVQESMISFHVGNGVMDDLFDIYSEVLHKQMIKEEITSVHVFVVLKKIA